MKLLVDRNLSPDWVAVLKEAGWEAEHWSNLGNPRAEDSEIIQMGESLNFFPERYPKVRQRADIPRFIALTSDYIVALKPRQE